MEQAALRCKAGRLAVTLPGISRKENARQANGSDVGQPRESAAAASACRHAALPLIAACGPSVPLAAAPALTVARVRLPLPLAAARALTGVMLMHDHAALSLTAARAVPLSGMVMLAAPSVRPPVALPVAMPLFAAAGLRRMRRFAAGRRDILGQLPCFVAHRFHDDLLL
ncbi:hypothetical protein [uncultured Desulfovibrio sp.]|uniref:Uncharacterized protein n=1 Tax=Candidatus Desulfovibrio intestinavium TaxID=2838534 RepID=A0A9D2HN55_9BACT|nr:hypothetical protein [uncultured Desulfovibrio sp.]HJA79985.1 hypothetical protein [Candidatus Desulfovibrio intestinavium]